MPSRYSADRPCVVYKIGEVQFLTPHTGPARRPAPDPGSPGAGRPSPPGPPDWPKSRSRSSCKSKYAMPRSLPGTRTYRRSTSLSGPASPRATEPKTASSAMPYFRHSSARRAAHRLDLVQVHASHSSLGLHRSLRRGRIEPRKPDAETISRRPSLQPGLPAGAICPMRSCPGTRGPASPRPTAVCRSHAGHKPHGAAALAGKRKTLD